VLWNDDKQLLNVQLFDKNDFGLFEIKENSKETWKWSRYNEIRRWPGHRYL